MGLCIGVEVMGVGVGAGVEGAGQGQEQEQGILQVLIQAAQARQSAGKVKENEKPEHSCQL